MSILDYVAKQASEWIGGVKRFLTFPFGPTTVPTEDYQLINKQYVDTGVASLSMSVSNLFSSITGFLSDEVIWSSTCNRLVVSTTADPAPTVNDIWIDLERVPSIVSTTTNYTLLSTNLLVLANASGGAISIVLGSAPVHAFRNYFIKKVDPSSNRVIVNPDGSETIDSAALYALVCLLSPWAGATSRPRNAGTENPAARVVVKEKGNQIYAGWLFSLYPQAHPMQHDRWAVVLKDFVKK